MKIRYRPPNVHFKRFMLQTRVILGVWAKFVGAVFLISLVFGPIGPLVVAAFIFSILLPVGLLILWGCALEAELGWTDPDRYQR